MQTKISRNHHYILVDLSGYLNYESIDQLRGLYNSELKGSPLVFNLENLKFVGSSGITDFVTLLRGIGPSNLHICSAKPEFYRLFESQKLEVSAFHNSSLEAHNHIESMRHINEQLSIPGDFIENTNES